MALPETYVAGFHDENLVKKMKYHRFGSTDISVSELSLGAAPFSNLYGDCSLEECKKLVEEALKSGINYIDTAPYYGERLSEEILGKCLKNIPRKSYYIATKVGRYTLNPKTRFDFSAERTKESIEISLEKLGLDYVDLLQIHDIEYAPNPDVILKETLPAVQEIVKAGKARFVGITGYSLSALKECISKSKVQINTMLCYSRQTLADDALSEYIPFLKSKNLGIVSAAPHAQGLLTNHGPQPWQSAPQSMKNVISEAREYCKKRNVELGRLALYHSLLIEGHHTNLVGMNTVHILRENLSVCHDGIGEEEKEVYREVLKILEKLPCKNWEGYELEEYYQAIKE